MRAKRRLTELFERVAQIFVVRAIGGIDSAENHRVHLAVACERLFAGFSAVVTVSPTRASLTVFIEAVI